MGKSTANTIGGTESFKFLITPLAVRSSITQTSAARDTIILINIGNILLSASATTSKSEPKTPEMILNFIRKPCL